MLPKERFTIAFWLLIMMPSEYNTYYDIEAVYDCLKKEYGIEEDLILYGQSVGSGPTLHLASRLEKLRGVVAFTAVYSLAYGFSIQ
ncbi:hypothetical protein SETIT_8G126400v2 [Setaria italica]|uniref:Serine aminopeptidase S33 domain-containing protein n=1 Tax=Setaria italica TaxID=4555 RepID=A0A368S7B7_SETIT|nr:hypothetical protein SETIT_8G126400v2 [Setaria italica]